MKWDELKREAEHRLKNLPKGKSQPRLNVLEAIEKILNQNFKDYIKYPTQMFSRVPKEEFKANYPKKLNGAEESVINLIYEIIAEKK